MDNIDLLEKLIKDVSLNRDPSLLHSLTPKILSKKYQKVLEHLIGNDTPTSQTMNTLNDMGHSPFLAYIEHFCSRFPTLRGEAMQLVNDEASKHGDKYEKFSLDNQSLFKRRDPNAC